MFSLALLAELSPVFLLSGGNQATVAPGFCTFGDNSLPLDFANSERYGSTAHSTYAELVDRLRDAEAENLFAQERSFIRRTRKGKRY